MLVIVLSVLLVVSLLFNLVQFFIPTPEEFVNSFNQHLYDNLLEQYKELEDEHERIVNSLRSQISILYNKIIDLEHYQEPLKRIVSNYEKRERERYMAGLRTHYHHCYEADVSNLSESDTDKDRNVVIDYLLFQLETAYEKPIVRFRVGDQEFIKECDALREMNKQIGLGNKVGPVERIERKVKLECDPNKLRNQVKEGDK